jgi:hypothetical protein
MLPAIRRQAGIAFRHLPSEFRDDAVQEVMANATVAYARLAELGRTSVAYPSVLARYGIAQYKAGRRVGNRLNIRDALSPYAQQRKRFRVESLDRFDEEENQWREAVVEDTRSSPVPETVAFRVDFADWLSSLPRRDRRIAESLAIGNRTGEVGKRFDVTAGRVSQLRQQFKTSWTEFHGEQPRVATIVPG